jgi:hypothetical protein
MTSLRCGLAVCLVLVAFAAAAPSAVPFSTRPITETATCHVTGDGLSTAVYDGISLSAVAFGWVAPNGSGGFSIIKTVTVQVHGNSGTISQPTPVGATGLGVSFEAHSPHSQNGVQVDCT